ncbi:MAG: amino acid racemase [Woeseiaceae bacterium]
MPTMEKADPGAVLGIVGGMGPAAGVDLLQRVYRNTRAQRDQDHLSVILVSRSCGIQDRTEYLLHGGENPAYPIFGIVRELAAAGATVIGMPCNTAHALPIYSVLLKLITDNGLDVMLIDMIASVRDFVVDLAAKQRRVGLLATTGTISSAVYQSHFDGTDIEIVLPDNELQRRLHDAIVDRSYGVKAASYPVTEKAKRAMFDTVRYLVDRCNADSVILGCTEIPLAFAGSEGHFGNLLVNPTEVLARAMVNAASPDRLLPIS